MLDVVGPADGWLPRHQLSALRGSLNLRRVREGEPLHRIAWGIHDDAGALCVSEIVVAVIERHEVRLVLGCWRENVPVFPACTAISW